MEFLSDFPQIGRRHEGRTDREVRILRYSHSLIAALVAEDRDVELPATFHGALDADLYVG